MIIKIFPFPGTSGQKEIEGPQGILQSSTTTMKLYCYYNVISQSTQYHLCFQTSNQRSNEHKALRCAQIRCNYTLVETVI